MFHGPSWYKAVRNYKTAVFHKTIVERVHNVPTWLAVVKIHPASDALTKYITPTHVVRWGATNNLELSTSSSGTAYSWSGYSWWA